MSVKALDHIRVLDLSRVLAGPSCTQILGDLGADIIKIEKPFEGDDTRGWGPPYLKNNADQDTTESAYYLSCNRNKHSLAIDIKSEKGRALIHALLSNTDVLIENFKTGGLAKYGLSYDDLKEHYPRLIYCSITGFGQNGPLAPEPGYDFLAQGFSGLMAHTGEIDGEPMKVGVAVSDIMTGLNAAIGILAALHAREKTGLGQHIDVALTDCTLAAMTNLAQYYLTAQEPAPRRGNSHASIVPYQVFETSDSHIILAIGNDHQFERFAALAGHPEWSSDLRFAKNRDRVANRETLCALIADTLKAQPAAHWLTLCDQNNVPCGAIHTMDQVFAHPQFEAREMKIDMKHPLCSQPIQLVGSPLKLSGTPVTYEQAPPLCGEHTSELLKNLLNLTDDEISDLEKEQVVQTYKI